MTRGSRVRTIVVSVVVTLLVVTAFNFWMQDQLFGNQRVESRQVDR